MSVFNGFFNAGWPGPVAYPADTAGWSEEEAEGGKEAKLVHYLKCQGISLKK